MATRKTTTTVPVTIEHTVGNVEVAFDGDAPAIVEALRIIGEYEADHQDGGVYRFGLATIDVSYKSPNGDDDLRAWLLNREPHLVRLYDSQTAGEDDS